MLNAADYQRLHSVNVGEIIQNQMYLDDLRIECTALYDLCDDDFPDDCIPEFIQLNWKRSEMRRVREQLKFLHSTNKYFKDMSRTAGY